MHIALKSTGTPARDSQTKDKPNGRWSPRKRSSVSLRKRGKETKNGTKTQIVPDDTHVIINLAFIYSNNNYFCIKRERKDSHEIKVNQSLALKKFINSTYIYVYILLHTHIHTHTSKNRLRQ